MEKKKIKMKKKKKKKKEYTDGISPNHKYMIGPGFESRGVSISGP